ncbi:hypothetical protein RCCGE510_20049 [Rhizobium sp. CCGE 510]|nr:hypothetical protein RCCGE510_20049 [Rhizobium sp. CCGE 510]
MFLADIGEFLLTTVDAEKGRSHARRNRKAILNWGHDRRADAFAFMARSGSNEPPQSDRTYASGL